jgi:LPS export ABC transporter protein LptC
MPQRRSRNPKRLKKLLGGTVVLIAVAIVTVFMVYRHMMAHIPEGPISIRGDADLAMDTVQQTAIRNGVTEWVLEAASAQYKETEKKAVLSDLRVTFYLQDGDEVLLTADHGMVGTETNDIQATGNVIARNKDYQIQTEQLRYTYDQRVLDTTAPVLIQGRSFSLRAKSLSIDLNTNEAHLEGQVEGTFSKGTAL